MSRSHRILVAMNLSAQQIDRAVGVVVASAAGDALGSHYEFGPSLPDDTAVTFGRGHFGHAPGEWTDDTSMAMPLLEALARGESLEDGATQGAVVARWLEWSRDALDVGTQTRQVLSALDGLTTAGAATAAARSVHDAVGRSGGNGSLMRTGPVALGYLHRTPAELAATAAAIAKLTHWEDDNADACGLWCLAIRHAVLTGELDLRAGLALVPADRRARWSELIDAALAPGAHPRDFAQGNGWVVRAFQGAIAAVAGGASLVDALERAVRGGHDTDTVAAIAGSLAGAVWGASAVPEEWQRRLHGWPGVRARELTRLAALAARHGEAEDSDQPRNSTADPYAFTSLSRRDDGTFVVHAESRWVEAHYEIAPDHAPLLATGLGAQVDEVLGVWKERGPKAGPSAAREWMAEHDIPYRTAFVWTNE